MSARTRGVAWVPTLLLAALAFLPGCSRSKPKAQLLAEGDQYVAEQKYAEAIISYRAAIQADEKFGIAHAHLSDAYLKSNDGYHALSEAVRAADLLPDDDAQIAAVRLLILAGRFADAKERCDKVLADHPKNVEAQVLKGNAMLGIADVDAALDNIQQAIINDPKNARSYAALGVVRMKQGQRDEAEKAFTQAVAAEPSSLVAQLALGHYYWAVGNIAAAEPPLKRAVELAPGNVLAQRALITFYLSTDRLKDALVPLKMMADTVKTSEARIALADLYRSVDLPDEAAKALRVAAKDRDSFADATVRLAAMDFVREHNEEAKVEVDAVLARQPTHVEALVLKARLLAAEGNLDDAIARAKEATKGGKRPSAAAFYLLGMLYARHNQIDEAVGAFDEVVKLYPGAIDARLQLVQLHLEKGAPQMALQYAEEAANLMPENQTAGLMLGRALTAHGDLGQAEVVLKKLAADAPGSADVHSALGELLLVKKDLPAAQKEFSRALGINPLSIDALRGSVSADIMQHNAAHAAATVESYLLKRPRDLTLLLLASQTYAAAGDEQGQEAALRKMIEVDPTSLPAYASLAALYVKQGKLDEAKAEYLRIGGEQPSSITAPTMVAIILEAQHKVTDAERAYERLLSDHPKASIAANNLAWLYTEHDGNLDVALELAQRAKQEMPNAPEVDDTLGWIHYKKDLTTLAVPLLESAVRAKPKNALFAYHLGMAYAKAGERAKAGQALAEALRLKPEFPEAIDAARALGLRQ